MTSALGMSLSQSTAVWAVLALLMLVVIRKFLPAI